eukprot:Opistho-2@29506
MASARIRLCKPCHLVGVIAFVAIALSLLGCASAAIPMSIPRQNKCQICISLVNEVIDYIRTREDSEELPSDFCRRLYDYHAETDDQGNIVRYVPGKAPILLQMESLGRIGGAPALSSMKLLADAIHTSKALMAQCQEWFNAQKINLERWRHEHSHLTTLKPFLCDNIFNAGCNPPPQRDEGDL